MYCTDRSPRKGPPGNSCIKLRSYAELALTNRQFAFARDLEGIRVIVTVNNDDSDAEMNLPTGSAPEYVGALTGQKVSAQSGRIRVRVAANSGEIWIPAGDMPEYNRFRPMFRKLPQQKRTKALHLRQKRSRRLKTTLQQKLPRKKKLQTLKIQIKLLTIQQTRRMFRQLLKQSPLICWKRPLHQIRTKHRKK